MPDAMMNGGYAPYLAQAFTPQVVPSGLFGGGAGYPPGNLFGNTMLGQNYPQGGWMGGISPFTAIPPMAQPYTQPNAQLQGDWQLPQSQPGQPFGQANIGWQQPYGQSYGGWQQPQQQIGQWPGMAVAGWQEPQLLAHLLRRYAVPISTVIASPWGQAQIAQNIVQTADMLTRVLPLVGAPQLVPVVQLLGQNAQPLSAAIASPFGQAQIVQNISQTAEMLARTLPLVALQQPVVPGLPTANLLFGQQPQYPAMAGTTVPYGGILGGQFAGPLAPTGDAFWRGIPPFLAQQNLAGQPYGMAGARLA
jgi:hypothetical protein